MLSGTMPRKLLNVLIRIGHIELGNYPATTSSQTLYRHHRIALTFGWLWIASGALMASSMVEFMLGREGWFRTLSLVVTLGSLLVCAVTIIPGIAASLWIKSIDQALTARGMPIPAEEKKLEGQMPRYTMRMVYWFAVAVIAASLVHVGMLHVGSRVG